eukprot:TRINITY_DN925_c0_g2_i2.p1 TRINITY_DN925_c0_g2~~TRINITY_DN925_c0_g2_i2.p1  ORF type:complete len:232 (-),score=19.46 TRINITY_DN925_c0_g2_i2:312-1007(-)
MQLSRTIVNLLLSLLVLECIQQVTCVQVTCGSLVKLQNGNSGYYLHSHEISYGSGSGQQSVTGINTANSAEDFWMVREAPKANQLGHFAPCVQGSPISKGSEIRLQHMRTRRWLHSHLHRSPLSNQQEVSCFGEGEASDTGDVWIVDWEAKNKHWTQYEKIRFKHKDTGVWLKQTEQQFNRPIPGQKEIVGSKKKDSGGQWQVSDGVFFPQTHNSTSSETPNSNAQYQEEL